jgi:hypothetical protein
MGEYFLYYKQKTEPQRVRRRYMNKFSIENTTREERIKIINRSLSCGGDGCENCSGCGVFGAGDPYDMYQPYIDGEMELSEINMRFRAGYTIKGR